MSIYASIRHRMHNTPRELKRFIKFAMVGATGSAVDFAAYNLLIPVFSISVQREWLIQLASRFGVSAEGIVMLAPGLAGACSFILAILNNFIWNRLWTYRDSRSKRIIPQFFQFFVINALGLVIRIPIITFTHVPFADLARNTFRLSDAPAEIFGYNAALALAIGIVMLWNFFVNRYITYSDVV